MGHHDLFFKKVFSSRENAADFVRHTLPPELAAEMDFNTLAIEKGSHVDAALAENFSDTVYTCQFSGTQIKIALLFEHKSAPDNNLPFQLYRYMGNLWKNSTKQKQPRLPVIPIVLYHGRTPWTPGSLISRFTKWPDAVKPYIPDFEFVFVDLSAYSNDAIKTSVFKVASLRIALLVMKNIFDQQKLEHHLTRFLEIDRAYFQEARGLKFLETVLYYILQVTEIEPESVAESVACISEKGRDIAMTTAEKLRQEGMLKGMQKGMQKGKQEGKQEGRQETMLAMVRNAGEKGLSEEMIAQITNLDIALVRKILNNEPVDIPLHLLSDSDQ
ncbi:MAG: Rpn family recombination-promoting nuclease/putative transposase [Thermodesulfobacteriota bacterium]|nr:Rpn family recombination-promoting nuclease/putative transposase [Thermodesulfobacteriota bacterium]